MQCPVCGERLREIEKRGVMIDICASCKGVWLDRGELEKILELAESPGPAASEDSRRQSPPARESRPSRPDDSDDDDWKSRDKYAKPGTHRRKRGIFGEIFDIFGD